MSIQAVLPKELLGLVLAYHGPDPREMIIERVTVQDMGMKWHHTTIEMTFNFPKIEQIFKELLQIAEHFGCKKEVSKNILDMTQPTYSIIGGHQLPWRSVSHLRFFAFIANPAPIENPSLPRLRTLLDGEGIADKGIKETVIIEGSEIPKVS